MIQQRRQPGARQPLQFERALQTNRPPTGVAAVSRIEAGDERCGKLPARVAAGTKRARVWMGGEQKHGMEDAVA